LVPYKFLPKISISTIHEGQMQQVEFPAANIRSSAFDHQQIMTLKAVLKVQALLWHAASTSM
jgi:hypothetical protein